MHSSIYNLFKSSLSPYIFQSYSPMITATDFVRMYMWMKCFEQIRACLYGQKLSRLAGKLISTSQKILFCSYEKILFRLYRVKFPAVT